MDIKIFLNQNLFGHKTFLCPDFITQNFNWAKTIFRPTFFLPQHFLILAQKNFLDPKSLLEKKIFLGSNHFWIQHFLGQNCFDQEFFRNQNFSVSRFFHPKYFSTQHFSWTKILSYLSVRLVFPSVALPPNCQTPNLTSTQLNTSNISAVTDSILMKL